MLSVYVADLGSAALGGRSSHVLDILKAVAQVTDEGMVDMLEHSSLANDISNTLRLDNYLKESDQLAMSFPVPCRFKGQMGYCAQQHGRAPGGCFLAHLHLYGYI